MPTVTDRLAYLLQRYKTPENVAIELSRVCGKTPPWTGTYVTQVKRRNLKPGRRFAAAVSKLHRIQPGVFRPTAGTWVPFRSKSEQDLVIRALTGPERRRVLLDAAMAKTKEIKKTGA